MYIQSDIVSVLHKYISVSFLFLAIIVAGCQTEIDVDMPEYEPKIVIEGTIENGQPAIVTLSRSISYLSEINLEYLLNNVMISDAEVTVTASDGETDTLAFQYCPDAPMLFAFVSPSLRGKEHTRYTLSVKYDDKLYTAETTIPGTFALDSVWFDNPSEFINSDSMRVIRVLMTDNGAENNYYAFSVKVHCPTFQDRLWASSIPIVFDDKTFNGLTFNYELERYGYSTLFSASMSEDVRQAYTRITFRPGDTVYVRHSQVDYDTYCFMITGGNEAITGSNPFINPAPVISNIRGERVLGNWSGFASAVDTLVW